MTNYPDVHGVIYPYALGTWAVTCARCGRIQHVTCDNSVKCARRLSELAWIQTGYGWTCKRCTHAA